MEAMTCMNALLAQQQPCVLPAFSFDVSRRLAQRDLEQEVDYTEVASLLRAHAFKWYEGMMHSGLRWVKRSLTEGFSFTSERAEYARLCSHALQDGAAAQARLLHARREAARR
eukprot:44098-Eustigmatos_ZCMA.PRE.1